MLRSMYTGKFCIELPFKGIRFMIDYAGTFYVVALITGNT